MADSKSTIQPAVEVKQRKRTPVEVRFWKYVAKPENPDGCWLWTGASMPGGYGQIIRTWPNRTRVKASRLSYRMHKGEIPKGHGVLHKCDNPPCVNPDHLFTGTQKDNVDDMIAKGRAATGRRGRPNLKLRYKHGPNPKLRGENNHAHKLTNKQVAEIRESYSRKERTQDQLAEIYGVTRSGISKITRGKTWKTD